MCLIGTHFLPMACLSDISIDYQTRPSPKQIKIFQDSLLSICNQYVLCCNNSLLLTKCEDQTKSATKYRNSHRLESARTYGPNRNCCEDFRSIRMVEHGSVGLRSKMAFLNVVWLIGLYFLYTAWVLIWSIFCCFFLIACTLGENGLRLLTTSIILKVTRTSIYLRFFVLEYHGDETDLGNFAEYGTDSRCDEDQIVGLSLFCWQL